MGSGERAAESYVAVSALLALGITWVRVTRRVALPPTVHRFIRQAPKRLLPVVTKDATHEQLTIRHVPGPLGCRFAMPVVCMEQKPTYDQI